MTTLMPLMPGVVAAALSTGRWSIRSVYAVDRTHGRKCKCPNRHRHIWSLAHADNIRYLIFEADSNGVRQDHATYDSDGTGGRQFYDDNLLVDLVTAP